MKGGILLAIYIAIAVAETAYGQKGPVPVPPTYLPPPTLQPAAIKPSPFEPSATTVIIKYGRGGRVDEHTLRFADYRLTKAKVELRGPCLSACTIVLAYVGPELLCVAPDGYMAFHAVRSMEKRELMPLETRFLYSIYPQPVRDWIDRSGGWQKLPLDGFWTLHSGELWAMGYPRCAP